MASVEWARSPSKESPASFVLFCKFTRSKATTADKLGFIGKEEGVMSTATLLLIGK